MIRIHKCTEIERDPEEPNSAYAFPTFFVICTKMKSSKTMKSLIELDMDGELIRVETSDEVLKSIKAMQEYTLYLHYIQNKKFVDEDVNLELYDSKNPNPRYVFYIIDQKSYAPVKFAVFIVPQGREMEWMFATTAGRKQLIENAGCERLVVVHLNRNHNYTNLDEVKRELSSKVMEFAQSDFTKNVKVPFMSVGPDIGHRTICYNGKSELSGEYIIEDVQGEGKQTFRRLVFLQNQYVIQSEARLTIEIVKKNKKTKKGKVTKNIDFNYLSCQHHIYMFSGLSFLSSQITEKIRVLMVGLGGGLLPMFMTSHIKQIYIDVVELDEEILKIAVEWFGLELSEKLKVHIADGIDFINNCAQREEKYDIVMLDVDNKDTSAGISCPPLSFVQEHFLQQIRKLIDSKGRYLIGNNYLKFKKSLT
ncbi:methyltransferase-like protein 13 [Centruroides sculpturatus]|uniref:methyltransferase-like protein 13 n=1 Tax=Centruroides sculpturatus TaxID=218467 RepID=UPI000C6CEE24|nr:methyltransferase-like protein 13 [Centruroides sculpturatus]